HVQQGGNGGTTITKYKVKTITKTNYIYRTIDKVKTGDYNNILVMLILLLGASVVITISIRKRH
ncbi:MAG: hypothetical protein LBM02_03060, partial [Lachnospiraceae bacterium]|nr:hypothetical protein [Lachnospiraceae bacterium]